MKPPADVAAGPGTALEASGRAEAEGHALAGLDAKLRELVGRLRSITVAREIGGRRIAVSYGGAGLASELDPFLGGSRLGPKAAAAEPAAATHMELIAAKVPRAAYDDLLRGFGERGASTITRCPDGHVLTHALPDWEAAHVYRRVEAARVRAFAVFPEGAELPFWERAQPFLATLVAFSEECGWTMVHGGAVARGGKAALIGGLGGSGKSTLCHYLHLSGWQYLGDDYVGADGARVYGVFRSGKLRPDAACLTPAMLACLEDRRVIAAEKHVYLHPNAVSDGDGVPLSALVFPRIGATFATRPMTKLQALTALAPSTVVQVPTTPKTALPRLKALVERVPAYAVAVPRDLAPVAAWLEGVLG
jgi:hypothetical protein